MDTKRSLFIRGGLIAAAVVFISLSQPNVAQAQSLTGIRVGDTASKLSKFGPVSGADKYKGLDIFKWIFSNRNLLTVTVDKEGEIVYVESDWGGKSDETGCDLEGLKFGVSTLADLEKKFGSKGFAYKGRPHARQTDDGFVLLNSWEADSVVITFYTRINAKDYAQIKAGGADASASEYAKLEGISMANAAYAKSEWGERVANPAYKKIDWK